MILLPFARMLGPLSDKVRCLPKGLTAMKKRNRFVDVNVAALDKRWCAVYSEKMEGPFRNLLISLVGNFAYRNSLQLNRKAYADFKSYVKVGI
jgi:hypothetical protein